MSWSGDRVLAFEMRRRGRSRTVELVVSWRGRAELAILPSGCIALPWVMYGDVGISTLEGWFLAVAWSLVCAVFLIRAIRSGLYLDQVEGQLVYRGLCAGHRYSIADVEGFGILSVPWTSLRDGFLVTVDPHGRRRGMLVGLGERSVEQHEEALRAATRRCVEAGFHPDWYIEVV